MTVGRQAILAAAVALTLAGPGCGGSSSSSTQAPSAAAPQRPRPVITLRAPGHRPVARAPWPITVRATTQGGRPLRASIRYQYLFGGQVVARRSHYRFNGRFRDNTFRWPARSVGYPLTFRAVVRTPLGKRNLDYPVTVVGK